MAGPLRTIRMLTRRFYDSLNGVFTDKEAWFLFKTSALLETIGWTLLIIGILFSVYKWPLYDYVLPIAGSLHGIFYIMYVLIVFFAHRSMKWSFWRFVVAEAVSVAPFAAWAFEQWVARRRRSGRV